MKVTTFYSYKGGLGRSLLLAWSARALAAEGHSVVALDLDLEAPGLAFKLGFGPDGPSPSAEYWQALASISWEELFFGPDPQGARFFTWLREAIEDAATPDHLLVDARTGVTELGGAALTLMADQILALLGTSPEGVYGTREVLRSVMAAPHPSETEVPRIGLILARMPATLATPALQRLRRVVRGQITEEADPLSATVEVALPLVVRSEPSLQEDESKASATRGSASTRGARRAASYRAVLLLLRTRRAQLLVYDRRHGGGHEPPAAIRPGPTKVRDG